MKNYALKMPRRVLSGENALDNIKPLIEKTCKSVTVFTDGGIEKSGVLELPLETLRSAGVQITVYSDLPAEPSCDQAQQAVDRFKESPTDLIVAIGGGSVMDVAKLASVAATDAYTVRDLLGNPLLGRKSVPTMMIPTTAGTGAEATANSIVAVPEREVKIGIVNDDMIPDYVVLDGRMTAKLPPKIAASTGVDALCHAIECYTSTKANPFGNLFAMESLRLIFDNIERACLEPGALAEKNNMLLAAFYGGVAISASGTTAVHALSYPLGGKYHIPHGVANAMLLMPVMRFNRTACGKDFSEVFDAVYHRDGNPVQDKGAWLLARMDEILRNLGLPPKLGEYRIGSGDLNTLVNAGMEQQRLLVNNKRPVTPKDARHIYEGIL